MSDINLARFQKFTGELLDGENEDFWYKVYENVGEDNPSFPDSLFPIGVDKEVFTRNPCSVFVNGWGQSQCPTMESLIVKIVRAYERAKFDHWRGTTSKEA